MCIVINFASILDENYGDSAGKESICSAENAGDVGLNPGSESKIFFKCKSWTNVLDIWEEEMATDSSILA